MWAATLLLFSASGSAAAAQEPSAGIAPLVEITDISGVSSSPDGRFVVFRTEQGSIAEDSYRLTWHAVDLESGAHRQLGGGGQPIYADPGFVQTETPVWEPAGRRFYVRALIDGAVGIRAFDLDDGSSRWAVIGDADIESVRASPDGRSLLYRVGPTRAEIVRAERREEDEGVLVDASVDLAQSAVRGGSINGRRATQRLVGYWTVRAGLLWRAPRQERRYDLLTGEDRAEGQPIVWRGFEAPSPVLRAQSVDGEEAVGRWDGSSGEIMVSGPRGQLRCTAPACAARADFLLWRPGARQLVFATSDPHRRQSLHLWDLASGDVRRITTGVGLLSGWRRQDKPCAITRVALVCVAAAAAAPPRLERIDIATGEHRILYDPNPGLRRDARATVRLISSRSPDGDEAAAILLLPVGIAERRPLFVNYYHCGGYLRGGEGDEWPVQPLLDSGFAVLCINAARHSRGEVAPANHEAALAIVRELIAQLDREAIIDPARVAMGGFSFGAEVAIWVAMNSDLVQALSIASTLFEPAGYWLGAVRGSDRPALMRRVWGLGRPEETPELWRRLSPALASERVRAPILLQMPEQEARKIPELYARLTASPTPVELYAFPNEGHVKVRPRHRLAVYQRNLDWFRFWLQGHRDTDPAKADQYRRWSELAARWRGEVRRPPAATAPRQPAR